MVSDPKAEEAKQVAQSHFDVDSGLEEVYRVLAPTEREAEPAEPLKLLEINRHTVPVGIRPVYFGADPANGARFGLVVLEIAPHEFTPDIGEQLRNDYGWVLGDRIPLPQRNGIDGK